MVIKFINIAFRAIFQIHAGTMLLNYKNSLTFIDDLGCVTVVGANCLKFERHGKKN